MTKLAMLGLGYAFLVLGVLGLFLPFLQGFLFLIVGLLILAKHAPWAERALARLKRTHPKAADMIEQAEGMADRWMHRTGDWFRGLWRRVLGRG